MAGLKKFISNIILAALVGALIVFAASLFLPKKWQVSGKIVVFPSGKPASASQNLSEEIGNTAWIVNGDTFQKRNFGDFGADFAGAEVVKNSSMVLVKFRSAESDIQAIEDLIVKIPGQVDEYARDLYDGSPFKYKMASDPEISARPAWPNVIGNTAWGFTIGAILYFLYWLMVEDFIFKKDQGGEESPIEPKRKSVFDFFPEMEEKETFEKKVKFEKPVVIEEKKPEAEIIEKKTEPVEKTFSAPVKSSSAPSNLPIAESEIPPVSEASEYSEPSDEEVKERLNKLMRGEL
ncbi:MAG: hypothetical protein QMD77_04185 [Patescibacteria group bacterium]|nr:hypothetical protein [Patescibacteria group bacterium]